MRVLLSNDDIRHWSDNLDWGVDDNGYLDIHNDDEIFASYPPGAWLGIEGPEPKQLEKSKLYHVVFTEGGVFLGVFDNSEMATGLAGILTGKPKIVSCKMNETNPIANESKREKKIWNSMLQI